MSDASLGSRKFRALPPTCVENQWSISNIFLILHPGLKRGSLVQKTYEHLALCAGSLTSPTMILVTGSITHWYLLALVTSQLLLTNSTQSLTMPLVLMFDL